LYIYIIATLDQTRKCVLEESAGLYILGEFAHNPISQGG